MKIVALIALTSLAMAGKTFNPTDRVIRMTTTEHEIFLIIGGFLDGIDSGIFVESI